MARCCCYCFFLGGSLLIYFVKKSMAKNSFNFTSFMVTTLFYLCLTEITVSSDKSLKWPLHFTKNISSVLSLYLESINFVILTTKTFKED